VLNWRRPERSDHARIVAVVDYFDALTMDRCYRRALPDPQALRMLARQRGKLAEVAQKVKKYAPGEGQQSIGIHRRPSWHDVA
jgi:HD-GYP domain-containing protein (c-di-GMP phosphodiesterase class II)